MMLIYHDDRFYYAAGSTDHKVDQLTRNSKVEVCIPLVDDEGGLRLRGEISFISVRISELRFIAAFIKGFLENPQDPDFVLMEFEPNFMKYMKPGSTKIERVRL
jgi:general stress protein 26